MAASGASGARLAVGKMPGSPPAVEGLCHTARSLLAAGQIMAETARRIESAVATAIERGVPGYTAVMTGSAAAGLAGPASDVDLALVPLGNRDAKAMCGCESELLGLVAAAVRSHPSCLDSVRTVPTRTKAPSLVTGTCDGIVVDISFRHGEGGASAGVYKSVLLRMYTNMSPIFKSLVLLIKQWVSVLVVCP